jgi:NhaP-type Na+/H+ or K+/H+ antiporter
MVTPVLDLSIMLYEIVQVIVAFIAVLLAIKWKKERLIAGLLFLLLYTILDAVDMFFFTITQGIYLDVAQFGFILLAIIFFIIGMNPEWEYRWRMEKSVKKVPENSGILSDLKKV